MKIKRVTISSQAWGDPYPCGDLTSVRIGGKEIGTCVGADEEDVRQIAKKAYRLGLTDAKKERKVRPHGKN